MQLKKDQVDDTNKRDAKPSEHHLLGGVLKVDASDVTKPTDSFEGNRYPFDNLLEGIQIHNFEWQYIYVNEALIKSSHYTREELLGETIMDKYPGIENSDLFKVLSRCMSERVSDHFETEFIFPDGSKTDFELSIQPVPEGLFILSIDISQRKKAEEQIKASEAYYKSVFEQANEIIFTLDASKKPRFTEINQSGCEMLGYSKDEILKLTMHEIIFDEDLSDSLSKIEELRAGKRFRHERRLKTKNGAVIETELTAKKMADGHLLIVAREVSERKRAEEKLAENEKRFRSLIENGNDMISLMDENFKILYRSPSNARITGWNDDEMKDVDGTTNIHPEDLETAKTVVKELLHNPAKPLKVEFRNLHKEKHYINVEGTATNLLHDPNVKAILFNFRDVTERKAAEEKLKLSEIHYRSIMEEATDTIYITDPSLTNRFIDINPSGCKMLGYTREEILGMKPTDILFEQDLQSNPIKIEQLKSGGPTRNERRLKRKDGTAVETESNGRMLENGNFIVYARDISERKRTEKHIATLNESLEQKVIKRTLELEKIVGELRESEEKFQKAFQTSAAGISITRLSDATFVDVNDTFIKLTGYSKVELINKDSKMLGMVADTIKRDEYLEEIKQQGYANNLEMNLINKSGENLIILVSVETIFLKGEKHALNIIYDITERKAIEKRLVAANTMLAIQNEEKEKLAAELTIANKELMLQNAEKVKISGALIIANWELALQNQEKERHSAELNLLNEELAFQNKEKIDRAAELEAVNHELESFSYSVSHDLRAPLRAIHGYTLMLKETLANQEDPETRRLINNVVNSTKKMGHLIDDLLTFSRLGRKELVKINIRMNEMVTIICEELKAEHPSQNIEFHIKDLLPAKGDSSGLRQVWINLIANAVKYSRLKDKTIIEISSDVKDDEIIYAIKDNGTGFDMRYADKLFGVFQRLHSEREFEGTGVGLAIVQRIVVKHGGRVWAESAVNQGATFYFSLNK